MVKILFAFEGRGGSAQLRASPGIESITESHTTFQGSCDPPRDLMMLSNSDEPSPLIKVLISSYYRELVHHVVFEKSRKLSLMKKFSTFFGSFYIFYYTAVLHNVSIYVNKSIYV